MNTSYPQRHPRGSSPPDESEILQALSLAESVYRMNCVAPGEPSSILAALQAAIAKAKISLAPVSPPTADEDGAGLIGQTIPESVLLLNKHRSNLK